MNKLDQPKAGSSGVEFGLPAAAGRCLALDVGDRRTGVAVGERLARPLLTLKRRSKVEDWQAIARLVREQKVDTLVVGKPLNMDGSEGFAAQRVVRYAQRLVAALTEMGLEVRLVFWDERLSTVEAQELLRAGSGKGRTGVDAAAAAVILQGYLDHVHEARSGDRPKRVPDKF
jgi:putative Holliday junction resolvase